MIQLNKFYSLSRYYRKPSIFEQACVFERSHSNCYQKCNIEFISWPSIFQTNKKGSKEEIKNLVKMKLDRICNGKERLSLTTMEKKC